MQRIDSDTFKFPGGCVIKRGAVGKPSTATIRWSRESDHEQVDVILTCDLVFTDTAFELTVSEVSGDAKGAAEFRQFAKEDGFAEFQNPSEQVGGVAEWLTDVGNNLATALLLSERYEDTDCLLAKVLPCAS